MKRYAITGIIEKANVKWQVEGDFLAKSFMAAYSLALEMWDGRILILIVCEVPDEKL